MGKYYVEDTEYNKKKIIYTFSDGYTVTVDDFDESKRTFSFKVNLPSCAEDYLNGNGEGVWCCIHPQISEDELNNSEGTILFVKILNDSLYYDGLKYGDLIPVVPREGNRPVALLDELVAKYGKSDKEGAIKKYLEMLSKDSIYS